MANQHIDLVRLAITTCLALLVGCTSYRPIENLSAYRHDRAFYERAARQHCGRVIVGYRDIAFRVVSVEGADYRGSVISKRTVRVHLQRLDRMGSYSTKDYRWTNLRVELLSAGSLVSIRYEPFEGMDSMNAEIRDRLSPGGQQPITTPPSRNPQNPQSIDDLLRVSR